MLIGKEIIDNIDQIVERAYISFMFDILGEDYLNDEQKAQIEGLGLLIGQKPLIELLYLLVRQRSEDRYINDKSLQLLLDEISLSGVLPNLNDTSLSTIQNAGDKLHQSIIDTQDVIKKKVKEEIFKVNQEEKEHMLLIGPGNIVSEIDRKDKAITAFGVGIALLAAPIAIKFARGFISTITDTVNEAAVDEALSVKKASEVKCKKEVVIDGRTCLEESEKVVLSDGSLVSVGDLVVGDCLANHKNHLNRKLRGHEKSIVTHIDKRMEEVYEFEMEDGTKLKCTIDHPILIKIKNRLLFIPIGELEKSIIPYKIIKYDDLSSKDLRNINIGHKWSREMGFDDMYYATIKIVPKIIEMLKKGISMGEVHGLLGLSCCKLSFYKSVNPLVRLYGVDPINRKYCKGKNFNKKYTDKVSKNIQNNLLLESDNIREMYLNCISVKDISNKLCISKGSIYEWVKCNISKEDITLVTSKKRARAGRIMHENMRKCSDKYDKWEANIRSKFLARSVFPCSKPQLNLFNSLKGEFSNAGLNVNVLDSFCADILINNCIIEYDGSGHYLFNRQTPRSDYVRDSLCKKNGYSVIRVKSSSDSQPNLIELINIINNIKVGQYVEIIC